MANTNPFYLEKIFPNVDKLFSQEYKIFKEVKIDCIFVLDTNILLAPFLTSKSSLSDIREIYFKLKEKDRLLFPARVIREYANNRGSSLANIFRKVKETIDRINKANIKFGEFPILEDLEEYKGAKKNEQEIKTLLNDFKENLDKINAQISEWSWKDPVNEIYKDLISEEIIIEHKKDHDDLKKDLDFRIEHSVAPGFKDSKKIDKGIGDLIIWNTIIEIGKRFKKHVTFVSNEKKNDWFYTEYKTGLFPKFELIDEFFRETGGHSLNIVNFEDFLISQEAKQQTITEIKEIVAPTGYTIIDENEFLEYLANCEEIAREKDGFVSSKFFIETYLADLGFDIGSSWELFNKLASSGKIEQYSYEDPSFFYPPISAVKRTKT